MCIGLGLIVCPQHAVHGQDLRPGSVVTVAGGSTNGYDGDGTEHAAVAAGSGDKRKGGALLDLPWGLAIQGPDLFVAESGNHRVRRIDTNRWVIYTKAGNGNGSLEGDGELATNASINGPAGIVVDQAGNVYVADRGNHHVRIVATNGFINTLAGSIQPGYSGDLGIATQAALRNPMDVAVDAEGNVYISDSGNNRIRRVDASGIITTIAGSGERTYDGDDLPAIEAGMSPSGIALDGKGGLLIADTLNHRIRLLDLLTGIITTLAGTGQRGFYGDGDLAQGARLSSPWGVAVSPLGDVFITDSGNNRIRHINMTTGIIETIGGNGETTSTNDHGKATKAGLWNPYGIAVDDMDRVYVADYLNHRVRRINLKKDRIPEYVPLQPQLRMNPWVNFLIGGLAGYTAKTILDNTRP